MTNLVYLGTGIDALDNDVRAYLNMMNISTQLVLNTDMLLEFNPSQGALILSSKLSGKIPINDVLNYFSNKNMHIIYCSNSKCANKNGDNIHYLESPIFVRRIIEVFKNI